MFNHKLKGFSLTEVLITLFLLVVLFSMASGAYANLIVRTRISTATSELHSALLYARSEALKLGGNVIICRSTSTHTSAPVCDGAREDSSANSGWGDGWLIFHDRDGDGRVSQSDTILRVQGRLFSSPDQGAIIPSPNRKQIKFNALGQVYGTFMQFAVTAPNIINPAEHGRYICIASGGRARVDKKTCSGK